MSRHCEKCCDILSDALLNLCHGNEKIYPFLRNFEKFYLHPIISLYTPLKIPIEENTNLPLNLFFLFLSSSSSLCAP